MCEVFKSQNASSVVATRLKEIVYSESVVSYYLLITGGKNLAQMGEQPRVFIVAYMGGKWEK